MELAADPLGGRTNICPRCRKDLTENVRTHLYGCAKLPAEVRLRAQALREAAHLWPRLEPRDTAHALGIRARRRRSHTSTAAGSSPTSPGGVQRAGLAHHLIDLRDVLLFEGDLLPGVFFEPHALVHYEREQVVVLAKGCALVIQRFTQDLGDVVFVGLDQLADVERRMAAERRHVFAGHGRMVHTLRGLVAHPADDRNTRVAEDHQRVMQIADHARELELQNGIETAYDFLGIDLVMFTGHDVLPRGGCGFSTQEYALKRDARPVCGRDHRVVEPGRVEVRTPTTFVVPGQLEMVALSRHASSDTPDT